MRKKSEIFSTFFYNTLDVQTIMRYTYNRKGEGNLTRKTLRAVAQEETENRHNGTEIA
jgi:hypothetical protein